MTSKEKLAHPWSCDGSRGDRQCPYILPHGDGSPGGLHCCWKEGHPPELGHQACYDGDYSDRPWVPQVECSGCGRKVACVRVSDGTIYRPFAWVFPDEAKPLRGLCGGCKAKSMSYADIRAAKERFKANSKPPEEVRCIECGDVGKVHMIGDGPPLPYICSGCR